MTSASNSVEEEILDRPPCQVGGVNQNYHSPSGMPYHIQIEDRGPVVDGVAELKVRRLNMIVYANYGEPNARIIFGRDYDFPDIRTRAQNLFIEEQIRSLTVQVRTIIAEKEERQVVRIKALIREYYYTKNEAAKKQFEEANALYPFLFSRAWRELKEERKRLEEAPAAAEAPAPVGGTAEVVEPLYPLDEDLRGRVIEIERLIGRLERDLERLKEGGEADDVLVQTCGKLLSRARVSLSGSSELSARRLAVIRRRLAVKWGEVRSRLARP